MAVDIADLLGFYDGPLGGAVRRHLGRVLADGWGDPRGLRVLGLGFACPFLPMLGQGSERVLALMPGAQGVVHWPEPDRSACALVDPAFLPLPDASVDRVLVLHALEHSPEPGEMLHEVARVLTDDGRAVLVFPNRRGLWARMDTTPFGQGQPFSRKQMRRLFAETQLEAEAWREALYMPPLPGRAAIGSASLWEALGRGLALPFAGLHVVQAVKRQRRPVPVRARRRARAARPVLVPVPASRCPT